MSPVPTPQVPAPRAFLREPDQLRTVEIVGGWLGATPGSALVRQGSTWVLCACTLEERVPQWRRGSGCGWLTASYAMLPGAGGQWKARERSAPRGRTMEIERLIGRSLRGAVDLARLPEWTLHVDCDVLQADGGTRTAAVTGGWVALARSVDFMAQAGKVPADLVVRQVAAVSVGMVDGRPLLDLDYEEDARASTDMNVVMTADGEFVEAQATAELAPFGASDLGRMIELAAGGIARLCGLQREAHHAHA
jgi:ribonuclease PH